MSSTWTLTIFLLVSSLLTLLPIVTGDENDHLHPLDPLTPLEINQVQTIIKQTFNTNSKDHITFHYVGLDDPDKPTLLSWLSNNPSNTTLPPHRAFVIVRLDGKTHELILDLSSNSIVSQNVHEGNGYPLFNLEEQKLAGMLPLTYQPFIESINKRGLNVSEVDCSGVTEGWYGEENSRRALKFTCFYMNGTTNFFMRPLEGITLVVGVDELKTVEYHDRVRVPLPKAEGTEYRWSLLNQPLGDPHLNHFSFDQPEGSGVKIAGHVVRGMVLQNRIRCGRVGIGQSASLLDPSADCPPNAVFFQGYFGGRDGNRVQGRGELSGKDGDDCRKL
ncbi:hypothetical protein FEM48_Zijuj07G0127100 [Ziziphus jujuba var. spinosa]|uniref:Amine oxidase n=1 Tax=Ziziphus jujuba var. spinosa TaxID=714518 RepID=A0A978V4P8_ZIZJJ|nr:hypothetical protein FEM48_Zijuj07G0127100 [Ziziphus jujuba var. spinosa]